MELISSVSSLGLGAVIAVVVINWKRQDDKKYQEFLETIIKSMATLIENNTSALRVMQVTLDNVGRSIDKIAKKR